MKTIKEEKKKSAAKSKKLNDYKKKIKKHEKRKIKQELQAAKDKCKEQEHAPETDSKACNDNLAA